MNLKSLIPYKFRLLARTYVRYVKLKNEYWRFLSSAAGARFHTYKMGPVPPDSIVSQTALMKPEDLWYKSRRSVFLLSGINAMMAFARAARNAGLDFQKIGSAYEIGCGGSRLIRHLRGVSDLNLVGSDLQANSIKWCRKQFPDISYHQNELSPPLVFLDSNSIDFAFAYSVFTHIPMEFQEPWIEELRRVLKPGGVATITTLGHAMAKKMLSDEERARFVSDGTFTMDAEHPGVSASSANIDFWDVFMTPEFTKRLYGEHFTVVDYIDKPQALVVLRKD